MYIADRTLPTIYIIIDEGRSLQNTGITAVEVAKIFAPGLTGAAPALVGSPVGFTGMAAYIECKQAM